MKKPPCTCKMRFLETINPNKTRRPKNVTKRFRIVLEGLRGEKSISEICRREGIAASVYYKWSKAFLEAGKKGLTKDTLRDATSDEVKKFKSENEQLKQSLAEAILEAQRYKKVSACSRRRYQRMSRNEKMQFICLVVSRQQKWHRLMPLVRGGLQVFSCMQENT